MNSPEPQRQSASAWLWRRPQRWYLLGIPAGGLVALIVGILITGGSVAALKYTETTAFCTSCHEMATPLNEYTHSIHYSNEIGIRAGCGNCHVPPTLFAGLWRHVKASQEVWGHLTGELNTPAKYEAHRLELAQKIWTEFRANDSAECRSCHTQSAMALAKQPASAASSHAGMPKSGMTCIDCHQGVAHTVPQGG